MIERSTITVDPPLCDAEVVTRAPAYLFGTRHRVELNALHAYQRTALPIVAEELRRRGVEAAGPPVALLRPRRDGSFEVTAAYPTAEPLVLGRPFVTARLPGGRVVQALHRGSWQTLPATYDRLSDWLATHGVRGVPLMWEEYLVGPGQAEEPADWRTRVVVPFRSGAGAG